MNQTPTNEHDEPGFVRKSQPSNPYEAGARLDDDVDLDRDAPSLSTADVQRLNRKALIFLGGIVLVLGVLGIWVFSGGLSGRGDDNRRSREEQVVIPAAPSLPELPVERPVVAEPELPPLPVIPDDPGPSPSDGLRLPGGLPGGEEMSLLSRRMADAARGGRSDGVVDSAPAEGGGGGFMDQMMPGGPQSPADGVTSAQPLYKPDTLLLRGTYIRCVLQSRVITDVPGYTSCVVTEPVYSVNGRRLLLPRGSMVFGSYTSDAVIGERAAIVWDRVTTPTGLDINMRSPGTDMLGAAGNPGHYSAHWGQRISSALLISMLSDAFKYAGAKHGPQTTSYASGVVIQNPYESNTARTMERLANMAMERNMSRPPTVTINQGTILNVYVARDVDFSAVMR